MPAPAPLNEQFNDSYGMRGITSSNPAWNIQAANDNAKKLQAANDNKRQGGVRNVKVTKKATGTAMQATGVSMQFAGKGMKSVGKTTTKAGARLTATGLGAIVGVPMMAVGGVATGAGAGMQVAGKQVSRSGRRMQKKAGGKKIALSRRSVKNMTVHVRALQAGFMFSLPVAFLTLFEMGFFMAAGALQAVSQKIEEVKNADNVVSNVIKFVVDGVAYAVGSAVEAIKKHTGFDIGEVLSVITDTLNPGTYFVAFWAIGIMFGFVTLLCVGAVYQMSGVNPIFGKGSGGKMGGFLTALVMYCLPMAHLLPWFLIWVWAIKKGEE